MAARTTREIRLTGLGTSMDDRIRDLEELSAIVESVQERDEISSVLDDLRRARKTCAAFCKFPSWGRTFDIKD